MSSDPPKRPDPIHGFADLAREIRPALPPRKRAEGWLRLAHAMASRRSRVDEHSSWWSFQRRRRLTWGVGLGLALACAALLFPVAKRSANAPRPQLLEYSVTGTGAVHEDGALGRVLSAQEGPVQLLFTDGSRVRLQATARVMVAALRAKGSDVRLLDGTIEVDVPHRPDTSWRFSAGPYVVDVKGTSFALGWNAAAKRLALRMRTGVVALRGPASAEPRTVAAGESVLLDGIGTPRAPAPSLVPAPPPPPSLAPATPASAAPRKERDRRKPPAHGEWAPLVAHGDFAAIVDQATRTGIDSCLEADTEVNLSTLADAARYTHRSDLARRSLLALRARFPATDRARDAAFFLARLTETASQRPDEALSWYRRYLSEAAHGSYAEEALGREMILLHQRGADQQSRRVARRYLDAYPRGIYAKEAVMWLDARPAP